MYTKPNEFQQLFHERQIKENEFPQQVDEHQIKENEFHQLVEEMKKLHFTESKYVSKYIVDNNLGEKYPNISGYVEMEKDGERWNFKGGFPKDIYRRLCRRLGLRNQRTKAQAINFISFKDLKNMLDSNG